MHTVFLVVTVLFALLSAFSALGKLQRDPRQMKVMQTVGVAPAYLPFLAACELAGAVGLLSGIWWPAIGIAGGIGLVLYFIGAVVAHLRVGDKAIAPAAFMWVLAAGTLTLRVVTMR
jgi:hypothetical protein